MPTQKKKIRKKKKISRKKLGLILLYLKAFKIFKIIFNIFLFVFIIYIGITIYRNKILSKFKNTFNYTTSKIFYKDICVNIEINGIERADINKIQNKVYEYCNLENKNSITTLLQEINNDPWIKNITIKRKLPNTLEIQIEEHLPFAIWKNNDNIHLINENGIIIQINENEKRAYYNLLIVAGDDSKENIYSLFNLLSSNPNLFSRIKSAFRIGERRWNLTLDNGILIKMPERDVENAWTRLDKILSINGSEINLKTIDLRNKDRVFLEEK